jgi:hypothetical protein
LHWGIWIGSENLWMCFDSSNVFWTTCREVADAQLRQSGFAGRKDVEIRAFESAAKCDDGHANDGG